MNLTLCNPSNGRRAHPHALTLLRLRLRLPLVAFALPLAAAASCAPSAQREVGYVSIQVPNHKGGHFTVITSNYYPDRSRRSAKPRMIGSYRMVEAQPPQTGKEVYHGPIHIEPSTSPTQPVRTCASTVVNWWIYLTGPEPCGRTTRVQAVGVSTSFIIEESVADGCDRIYLLWNPTESKSTDQVIVSDRSTGTRLAVLTRTSDSPSGETYVKINHAATGPVFEGVYSVDAPGTLNRRTFVNACAPY